MTQVQTELMKTGIAGGAMDRGKVVAGGDKHFLGDESCYCLGQEFKVKHGKHCIQ